MAQNVHDALFKAAFSRVEHAASILRSILPAAIAARIDFTTLALCPGAFVDEALKERYSDLLFSADLDGHRVLVYLLFEHQSTFEPLMGLRLIRYLVRVWDRWLAEHPTADKIPVILPVVLHHSEAGWRGSTAFEDTLDVDPATLAILGPHVPRFRFVLEDISHETNEALRARASNAVVRMVLACFRHARRPRQMLAAILELADLLREVYRAPDGGAAFRLILRYVWEVSESTEPEEAMVQIAAALDVRKEEVVTIADWLREQGREQGIEQGIERGRERERREMVLEQLRDRFGTLPAEVVARVEAAPFSTLRVWSRRLLTAPSLAEVLVD